MSYRAHKSNNRYAESVEIPIKFKFKHYCILMIAIKIYTYNG